MKPYYEDESVTLYHGDCLDVLPTLPVSAETVITDPPYALPTIVAANRGATSNVGDLSIPEGFFRMLLASLRVTPAARMFWFCDGTSYPVLFRAAYGRYRSALLVWDKGRIGMGREFRKSHELILHLWQEDTPIHADGVGRPDILMAAPVGPERLHPAEKPAALLAQLLAVAGPGVVLDPFAGSGSTLRVAKDLGRRAIGIEIEERYCEVAAQRLAQEVLV